MCDSILTGEIDLSGVREEVLEFALDMERKLKKNDYKKHWKECSLEYLQNRLKNELQELNFLLKKISNKREVINECADIANFAMMIADIMRERRKA
uniref:Uncharacterized protein n=1 Tax=viral metagenome TaxID=1070528 RepID=A0A6M3K3H0_9ZZZZ